MSYIAQLSDEPPKGQVVCDVRGTIATTRDIHVAHEIAAALNNEAKRRDDERLKAQGACKCEHRNL